MSTELPFEHRIEAGMFVRVRRAGTDAPWLVYVHGLGESGLCFEAIARRPGLAGYNQAIVDLPGYGRSAWPEVPLSLSDAADHLAAWLPSLGGPCWVAGHSMGGVIAVLLAERHPSVMTGSINTDGNVTIGDCSYSRPAAEASLEDFVAHGFDALRAGVYAAGADDEAHRGYYASMRLADPRTFHRNARELVEVSTAETMAARMAALSVPMAYIAGQPGGAAHRSIALLRDAGVPLRCIEPAGHWPFIDQPAAFVEALRELVPA